MKKYMLGLVLASVFLNVANAQEATPIADNQSAVINSTENDTTATDASPAPLLADNQAAVTSDPASDTATITNSSIKSVDLPGDEHVVWDKRPIAFVIPTGKERMITFPDAVVLTNNNPELTADKLSVNINNGTLYMKALQAFSPVRVDIMLQTTGEHVLLDISSVTDADDTPLDVVLASNSMPNTDEPSGTEKTQASVNYVSLLRFAIQNLYAPQRLIESNADISRTPMFTQKSVSLFYGDKTIAMPAVSWRGGNFFVTAVIIKNIQAYQIILDPRQVKGNWLASAFYPTNRLTENGGKQDKTTLFLVSTVPFGEALTGMDGENKQ